MTLFITVLGYVPDDMVSYTSASEQDLNKDPYKNLIILALK